MLSDRALNGMASLARPGPWLSMVGLVVIFSLVSSFKLAEPTTLPGVGRASQPWSGPFFGFAIWFGLLFVSLNCRPLESERAGAGSRTTSRVFLGLLFLLVSCLGGADLAAYPMFDLGQGDLWAGAQYGAALWAVVMIVVAYWNCFEIYWDLIWHCPVLACELGLMLGMALGFVLPGYGLIHLFWGDGIQPAGALIVPILSSSMIVLSMSVLLLCGYFSSTIMFDHTLAGGEGLDRDRQISRRVSELWQALLPGAGPEDYYKMEPGHFVWWCLRPLLLLLAIPAALPALSVDRLLNPVSRGGWIVGLALAGWAIRWLLIDRGLVRWVGEVTSSDRPKEHDPEGPAPSFKYPLTINARGLFLITAPLMIALLVAHAFDITDESRTRPGVLILVGLLTAFGVLAIWSLHWPSRILRQYTIVTLLAILAPALLSWTASRFGRLYIAAPFSICWLLMAIGVFATIFIALVSGFILRHEGQRRARFVRRAIHVLALVVLLLVLRQNGTVQVRSMTSEDISPDLALYDAWFERYMTDLDRPIQEDGGFGSPQLRDASDRLVLERWREKASPRPVDSDEPMPVGIWRRDPDDANRATRIVDLEPKPKLIVVAVSGGGLRAGIWAEKVLYELEKAIPEFPDRTRLITGSSGGMLGAARYVAGLTAWDGKGFVKTPETPEDPNDPKAPIDARVYRELRKDYLTPVVHRMVFGDVEMISLPGLPSWDRGMVLEGGFLQDGKPKDGQPGLLLNTTFEALARKGETMGRIPSLVFSPTIVEDSRRLIISNLDLGPLTLNHGAFDKFTGIESYEPGTDFPYYSCTGVQYFHLYPQEYGKLKLGTAVRMNATFPYVTPAVSMPALRPRRVVDAGYYDNYGVDLAVGWLEQNRRWLETNTSGVILIQVRAFSNESQLKHLEPKVGLDGSGWLNANLLDPLARGTQFLTTPLVGIGTARMNVNYYRNDAAVESLKRSFTFDMLERLSGIPMKDERARPGPVDQVGRYSNQERDELEKSFPAASSFFRVITFTCSNEKPQVGALPIQETLNWYLSEAEFANIVGNWHTIDNYRRFQYLKTIFRRSFESDLEVKDGETPPARWRLQRPMVGMDPREKTLTVASARGKHFLVAGRPERGEVPARVQWAFEKVPPRTFMIAINLPAIDDTGLVPDSLSASATYSVEITAGGKTTTQRVAFPLQSRFRKGPDDRPVHLLDYDEEKSRGDLGRWFVLLKDLKITETSTVKIELTNAGADGTIIADAVRLE
jgi:Patatin-like phospholipase